MVINEPNIWSLFRNSIPILNLLKDSVFGCRTYWMITLPDVRECDITGTVEEFCVYVLLSLHENALLYHLDTWLPACLPACLPVYIHTYLPTYLHTHTYHT